MTRTIYRGDSYGVRRPFYTYTFVDEADAPMDLAGCTVRVTYKPSVKSPQTDPDDSTAEIKHFISLAGDGSVIDSDGLYLESTAAAGVVIERLVRAETLGLTANLDLFNDVELTDSNGEVFTWVYTESLRATDAYTNRTTDG